MQRLATAALASILSGCFSWTQADPPPREEWDRVDVACDESMAPAVAALVIVGLTGGGAAAIFATTEDDSGGLPGEDFEERILAGMMIPVAVGYGFDAINAWGDASRCREYRARRARAAPATADRRASSPARPSGSPAGRWPQEGSPARFRSGTNLTTATPMLSSPPPAHAAASSLAHASAAPLPEDVFLVLERTLRTCSSATRSSRCWPHRPASSEGASSWSRPPSRAEPTTTSPWRWSGPGCAREACSEPVVSRTLEQQ
jgi:hypothetical protein